MIRVADIPASVRQGPDMDINLPAGSNVVQSHAIYSPNNASNRHDESD